MTEPTIAVSLSERQHGVDAEILSGDPVDDEVCPKCRHIGSIVYNGNYWCTRCPWVMAECGRPKRIVAAYLRQKKAEYLARGDEQNAARMEFHLGELGMATADVMPAPLSQTSHASRSDTGHGSSSSGITPSDPGPPIHTTTKEKPHGPQ